MSFTPSPYQAAIFDFLRNDTRSAIVEAVAGSGKTTTIVQGLNCIPGSKQVLMLAFNKSIATEMQSRVPSGVKAATFHSTGLQAFQKSLGCRPKIDGSKIRNLIRDNYGIVDCGKYTAFACRLVGYAKNAGMGFLVPDEIAQWFQLVEHFDLQLDHEEATTEEGIAMARFILKKSNDQLERCVDFDDMLFGPLIKSSTFWQNDFVFVDESQDTNLVQQALLKRMIKRDGGRLIAVGDPYQAIYGFRGADSSAMDRIKTEFDCVSLPLTVSYRCPQSVVRAAQAYVPHIEAHDAAPEGEVVSLPDYTPETFSLDSAILCRNTAPLVAFAYSLISRGKGCRVLGKEIGEGLTAMIKKLKPKGIEGLIVKLEEYERREVAKFTSQGKDAQAAAVEDKCACILIFIGQLTETNRTVPALCEKIESLFSDDRNASGITTLSTCHKAKGMEWREVFILDKGKYMPSKYAKQEWQQTQETNLIYVAFTRAKSRLCFIQSDTWKGGAK